jgi:ABC-2 type transport system ATP-binding protein
MEEAEYCGRIAIIDRGRIVALDTPEGLKRGAGGDLVTLEAADLGAAVEELRRRYGIGAEVRDGHVRFEVPNGSEFVPQFLQGLAQPVRSLAVRRPTLDDVFLRLTGRAIRDEDPAGQDAWRGLAKEWGRNG